MVEQQYNKYLIENMKRINSRYYVIQVHGKTYIIDYFDSFNFKNYFPFKIFYQNYEKYWKIYDVSGNEALYKAKVLPLTKQYPSAFWLLGLYPIYFLAITSFFIDRKIVLGSTSMILFPILVYIVLRYMKKKEVIDLAKKTPSILYPADRKKVKNIRFKKIIEIFVFILIIYITFPIVGWGLFFLAILIAVGNFWNNSLFIPDTTLKYKIKENKEN